MRRPFASARDRREHLHEHIPTIPTISDIAAAALFSLRRQRTASQRHRDPLRRTTDWGLVRASVTTDVERVVFALVANRALEPTSKLAATQWVAERAWIPGLEQVSDDACYRAMDWLGDVADELAEQTYWATADLLNLEVDLLFFDTTSTYFETDTADTADDGGGEAVVGFRSYGNSKDHRADLPQVVIGMAVTRTGIPIRVWTWPGNTGDSPLIRQVKDDLRAWKLGRVVWVTDRGFASAANRRYLQRAGGHYICGEKLRGDSDERGGVGASGPVSHCRGEPARQGSRRRRRHHARPVHRLSQPRRRRA